MTESFDVVTGAFSFTGRYLTRRLLARGRRVQTLTGHPDRPHPFGDRVPAHPWDFDRPERLEAQLRGAATLYNTYWIRFEYHDRTYRQTLERTRSLVTAARRAGVQRLVHFSSSGADSTSDLGYFRAKAQAEAIVRESGLASTILRPTLLFGDGSMVFNNLAWALRRFPFFALCGAGDYPLQPLGVDDLAALAIELAAADGDVVREAGGPETLSYRELVGRAARAVGRRVRFVEMGKRRMLRAEKLLERLTGDVLLTREELEAVSRGLLVAAGPPAGASNLDAWLQRAGSELGRHYRSTLRYYYR